MNAATAQEIANGLRLAASELNRFPLLVTHLRCLCDSHPDLAAQLAENPLLTIGDPAGAVRQLRELHAEFERKATSDSFR